MFNKVIKIFRARKETKKKIAYLKRLNKKGVFIDRSAAIINASFEGESTVLKNTNLNSSKIGFGTIIVENCAFPNCKIGRFCSIASDVHVVYAKHPLNTVSTYPGFYDTLGNPPFKSKNHFDEFYKTSQNFYCEIGNDVWIGERVLIKGGVIIGDGAIIGMGAVVTKNVPPYTIVGGTPAKIIRYRMSDDDINAMLQIKWWNWPIDLILNRKEEFAKIDTFIKKYL